MNDNTLFNFALSSFNTLYYGILFLILIIQGKYDQNLGDVWNDGGVECLYVSKE